MFSGLGDVGVSRVFRFGGSGFRTWEFIGLVPLVTMITLCQVVDPRKRCCGGMRTLLAIKYVMLETTKRVNKGKPLYGIFHR